MEVRPMKRLALLPATLILVLMSAPGALARDDAYWTVVCDGVSYESVDAHAIEQGGKLDAVLHFGEKHDMDCGIVGPFTN
jgi:hypothetical protein